MQWFDIKDHLEEAGEAEKEDTSASKKPRLDLLDVLKPTASRKQEASAHHV